MGDRGVLGRRVDSLQQALAASDHAAVRRCIEHVRAEAGPEIAAVLERVLTEQEAQPVFTPTAPAGSVRELTPRSRELLVVFLTVAVVTFLLVVAVLVTVIILRPPTTTASCSRSVGGCTTTAAADARSTVEERGDPVGRQEEATRGS